MGDLVERLRSPDEANDENICRLLDDAADEIERLQRLNATYVKDHGRTQDQQRAELERLETENAELRTLVAANGTIQSDKQPRRHLRNLRIPVERRG